MALRILCIGNWHIILRPADDLHDTCRNMSNNAISGPLPTNWGYGDVLTQLQIITLEDNRLTGALPASFSQGLKSLIVLNVGSNSFSGAQQLRRIFCGLPAWRAWQKAVAWSLTRQ